jgi:AmmeMemoRadiSam system protein B
MASADAVFAGSTDLTHYGPDYGLESHGGGESARAWAWRNDEAFLDALERGDELGALEHARREHSACCPGAAVATLAALRGYGHAAAPRRLLHSSSWQVHEAASFVGYAGVVF